MTTKVFADYLLSEYEKNTNHPVSDALRVNFLDYALGHFSTEQLESLVTKKQAAIIIHQFLTIILKLKDADWKDAGKFQDIYECRVCANAIAQCYVRGIMLPRTEQIFGIQDEPSESDLEEYVKRAIESDRGEM